jgi:hypothetical protein
MTHPELETRLKALGWRLTASRHYFGWCLYAERARVGWVTEYTRGFGFTEEEAGSNLLENVELLSSPSSTPTDWLLLGCTSDGRGE